MNTPTPTPRTDAAWAKTFDEDENQCRAGNAASDMRDECATLERELAALTAERDHLHAQLRALTLICGTNDANKFETWIDRANARAEEAEAQLATERARLDWLLSYDGVDWILSAHKSRKLFEGESDNRALLEAAMKEGAK